MNKELQNKLFEKYPKLFVQKDWAPSETLMCFGLTCGDGWYNIIDNLCKLISEEVEDTPRRIEHIKAILEKTDISFKQREIFDNLLKTLESSRVEDVQVVQVKEKYGTLSFYVNNYNEKIRGYIEFAGLMSGCTCETCGLPGKPTTSRWIKTMCPKCESERYKLKESK